jgi:hypothetical protein
MTGLYIKVSQSKRKCDMSKGKTGKGGGKDPQGQGKAPGGEGTFTDYPDKQAAGYCVWQYQAGTWVLKKVQCSPDFEAGSPPREKGAYEGECKRGACVPKSARKK